MRNDVIWRKFIKRINYCNITHKKTDDIFKLSLFSGLTYSSKVKKGLVNG